MRRGFTAATLADASGAMAGLGYYPTVTGKLTTQRPSAAGPGAGLRLGEIVECRNARQPRALIGFPTIRALLEHTNVPDGCASRPPR